jgi:hypothetical protein
MTRGKPFPPGNEFGKGRPRGSRNKSTVMAQELLNSHAESVVKKCLFMALQGDSRAMQLCMDRILPARRDAPVKLGKLPTATAAELSKSSEKVTRLVAEGKITPTQGQAMAELLEQRRRVIETEDIDARLKKMEAEQCAA